MKNILVIIGAMQHRFDKVYEKLPYHFDIVSYKKLSEYELPNYSGSNITHYRIDTSYASRFGPSVSAILRASAFVSSFNRLIEIKHPDIIHAHFIYPNGFTIRKPDIIQTHGSDVNAVIEKPYLRPLLRRILLRAKRVVACSKYTAGILRDFVGAKKEIVIIYNYVDTSKFKPNNHRVFKKKTILYLGRFSKEKGIDILVKLSRMIPPDYQIVCVGYGELKDYLKKNGIKVYPFTNYPEKFINSSYCVILPSLREGFPFIILEVMACGKYPLAMPVGGVPEIIEDGKNGFFINRNPSDILDVIKENESRLNKINEEGLKTVKNKFTLNNAIYEYQALYETLH